MSAPSALAQAPPFPGDPTPATRDRHSETATLLERTRAFADQVAARPSVGAPQAPLPDLARLGELGVLSAALPRSAGGLGLGLEPGTQRALLELLSILGGADLALGRIVEGHINALLLIHRFGSSAQGGGAARDCLAGRLFGVWNTGAAELMRLEPTGADRLVLHGAKTFATGADFVSRPIVTADRPGVGWQMTLPRMETSAVAVDRSFWHPFGMESTGSYAVDFTGVELTPDDLIGQPGDFYRDPLFRGGAVRFAAVQAGAVLQLHALFAAWLETTHRGDDPYQIARLGEVALLAQQAVLWVERSAAVAETSLFRDEPIFSERMVECANMTRLAIERISTEAMRLVTLSIGAHGLLQPHLFERLIRNLTMYLRQPAPDETLRSVGQDSLRKSGMRVRGAADGFWSDDIISHSDVGALSPTYFARIYAAKDDPWDFATSDYESAKYATTLASLPRAAYSSALEIGCSIGVLTQRLAARCDRLLSLDLSDHALRQARERCAALPQVHFEQMNFPLEQPSGPFDLIVLSEVAYYWSSAVLDQAIAAVAALQPVGGHLVLVHWTPTVRDYPLTGDEVHDRWLIQPQWRVVHSERAAQFRLDLLERIVPATARDREELP